MRRGREGADICRRGAVAQHSGARLLHEDAWPFDELSIRAHIGQERPIGKWTSIRFRAPYDQHVVQRRPCSCARVFDERIEVLHFIVGRIEREQVGAQIRVARGDRPVRGVRSQGRLGSIELGAVPSRNDVEQVRFEVPRLRANQEPPSQGERGPFQRAQVFHFGFAIGQPGEQHGAIWDGAGGELVVDRGRNFPEIEASQRDADDAQARSRVDARKLGVPVSSDDAGGVDALVAGDRAVAVVRIVSESAVEGELEWIDAGVGAPVGEMVGDEDGDVGAVHVAHVPGGRNARLDEMVGRTVFADSFREFEDCRAPVGQIRVQHDRLVPQVCSVQ